MKQYFKLKTWLITLVMFCFAVGLSILMVYQEFKQDIKTVQAGSGDNVSGYAWSENFGWISFNCTDKTCANDRSRPCAVDADCVAVGGVCNDVCGASNYGVNINVATGDFSGYAWSPYFGWISFNRRTCVGGSDAGAYCTANNDCSSNSCRLDGPGAAGAPLFEPYNTPASLKYNAIYNFSTNAVTGWAKILTLGNDGWVKLRKFSSDSGPDYGLSINPAAGYFSGWAWNGNSDGTGIGWASFNCADSGAGGCTGHDYRVTAQVNRPPQATNLTAPNWNFSQASSLGALKAFLKWDFSDSDPGSAESAYQLIFDDDSNPSNPIFDTGKCTGYELPPSKCKIATGVDRYPVDETSLGYNTRYYWWVKVWDNYGVESNLKAYDTTPDTDNDDGNIPTFTTYKHEFPDVDFTRFPENPSMGEEVKFTDASHVYLTSAPSTPVDCDNAKCDWEWTVPNGDTINDVATSTPTIIFNSSGAKTVTLKVTDIVDGYYTSYSQPITVKVKLPTWKEVK